MQHVRRKERREKEKAGNSGRYKIKNASEKGTRIEQRYKDKEVEMKEKKRYEFHDTAVQINRDG